MAGLSLEYAELRLSIVMAFGSATTSPIPCDVFYVACGVKRYPTMLFWTTMVAARFVRHCYKGYIFKYAPKALNWALLTAGLLRLS